MNKFENVDIFASLDAIMRQNSQGAPLNPGAACR